MIKQDRKELDTHIRFYFDAVQSAGGAATIKTAGSGAALDQAASVAEYVANPSGKVVLGILVNDVVNKDLTKTHLNFNKDEVQVNSKVTIVNRGEVVTNMIISTSTPTAGSTAYVIGSGMLSSTASVTGGVAASPVVGQFLSSKDENGFATVAVNLP